MSPQQPLISIITPSYNASLFIEQTINSVRKQTYQNWEMIIVDDCSSDNTPDILERFNKEDDRIHVIYLTQNGGAAVARNTALQHAKGRYVAFLDSDDCWKPEKLQKQLSFMQTNKFAFTFTGYELVTNEGVLLNKQISAPEQISYNDMLKNTIIGCLTVMIDREMAGDIQMPNIRTRQDLATWLSILKKGINAYGLNENLAEYRIGNPSISRNKWKAAKMNWFVYRKVEKLNVMKAFWCFSHYAFHAVLKRI
ncbi:glycosyltransferase family 2 protein [Neobacillus sp. SuZ13]|uniref:teichuronic acid biosynthesis protein TuaG n=1 Tax=Neobacillus sp. SuZ13 TaxID=3047875 RepID=UPI0024BF90C3|nr:glycosyltransferase family 2 protein [Neobacillus sp. SuZ13]WHY64618.1 glycosyltransferase family 2 protein [Neobacillus sp. SuZ13]